MLKFWLGENGGGGGAKEGDTIFDSNLVGQKSWRKLLPVQKISLQKESVHNF